MFGYLEFFTLALIPGFIALDLVYRKRSQAPARFWRLRAAAVSAAVVGFTIWVAGFWGRIFGDAHLLDLGGMGAVTGAAVGVLVYEWVHYWYHRAAHRWTWLWRAAHQMHHSAETLDAFGANYLHPLDAAFFTTWSSLVFFPLLGLRVEAGILGALFLTFNAMFQHANIPTPHWLGYLIQRPESHTIHHARGVHRQNYADLPLWDLLFGTFENPRSVDGIECGFYPGASGRLVDLLVGRDVTLPKPARRADEVLAG